ncbi:MAG: hypothetical protein KDK36_16580 [Leptospiraceae bacterium]|nr:hypothetical protein [Leptospiraceae bacterium]
MKALKFLSIIVFVFFISNCQSREDTTLQKSVLTYLITCTGGSLDACNSNCSSTCGIAETDAVTGANLSCMTSCQSTCSTNCNSLSLLFTFIK